LDFDCVYIQSASSSNVIVDKDYLSNLEDRLKDVEEDIVSMKRRMNSQQLTFPDDPDGRGDRAGVSTGQYRVRNEELEVNSESIQDMSILESGIDGMGAMEFSTEEDCGFFGIVFDSMIAWRFV
jgi:hypothetical protein